MMAGTLRRYLFAGLPWCLLIGTSILVFSRVERPSALLSLWRPWAEIGTIAFAMTAIMLTGGIDLSVGSIVALCGMVLGLLWRDMQLPIWLAAAAAVSTGIVAGALNGGLVVLGVAPLVATLATMALYAGLAMTLSGGDRIAGLPESFTWLGGGWLLGLPVQSYLLGASFVVAIIIVHYTRYGRYLFAIGDNRTAAEFAAVPVQRVEWSLYVASGVVASLVALAYTARAGAAVPNAGRGLELQVIACVVVGGTRVSGGAGGIGRSLLGLVVMAQLEIGLRLLRRVPFHMPWSDRPWQLDAEARLVVIGVLLIAVAVFNERLDVRRAE